MIQRFRICVLSSFGFLLLCAAAVPTLAQERRELETSTPRPQPSTDQSPEFRLSPGDVIEIKFFYNSELNDSMQIRPDGCIALPLIGDVELRNKTVAEASKMLEALYAPFLKTPSVTIQVRGFASQKVYVGGEVFRPGAISLAGELTILDAIMEAGGAKHTGKKSSAILLRKGENGLRVMQVISLRNSKGEPSRAAAMLLRPFDVVLVPETGIARVDRWVDQNIRQVIPISLSAGFSYLFNPQVLR
jgi:polysaccharide export outer membrane protein